MADSVGDDLEKEQLRCDAIPCLTGVVLRVCIIVGHGDRDDH